MPVSVQVFLNSFQCCPHSFLAGFPDNGIASICTVHPTIEGETEELEGFRLPKPPSLPVLFGIASELWHACHTLDTTTIFIVVPNSYPLDYQADNTFVFHPVLYKPDQPIMVDLIEKFSNIKVQHPVYRSTFYTHDQCIHGVVLASSRAKNRTAKNYRINEIIVRYKN